MSGRWVVPLSLLAIAFSGCVGGAEPDVVPLTEIYGENGLLTIENVTLIAVPALEAVLLAPNETATWQKQINFTYEEEITLEKADPGPMGGGGVEQPLTMEASELTLTVRFVNFTQLSGYQARWLVLQDAADLAPGGELPWGAPRSASAGFSVPVKTPGLYIVAAELTLDGETVALTGIPFLQKVDAHWVVESSVFPTGTAAQGQKPENWDEMADAFPFNVTTAGGNLVATTAYRGMWTPPNGNDVDLELRGPSGACDDFSGNPSDPMNNPPMSAEAFSSESIELGMTLGNWTLRVGALTSDCTEGAYANGGPVPYTLDVRLRFSAL